MVRERRAKREQDGTELIENWREKERGKVQRTEIGLNVQQATSLLKSERQEERKGEKKKRLNVQAGT